MGRHYRPSPWRRLWVLFPLLGLFLAIAGLITGAVLLQEGRTDDRGFVLEDTAVLEQKQYLIPQETGGYLLVSGNETETLLTFLTKDGEPTESTQFSMTLWKTVVQDHMLYLIGGSMTEEDETLTVLRLPLQGQKQTALEETTFSNLTLQLRPESLCIQSDTEGQLTLIGYAEQTGHLVQYRPGTSEPAQELLILDSDGEEVTVWDGMVQDGTLICTGETGIRSGLWQGTLSDTGATVIYASEALPVFPCTLVNQTTLLDEDGQCYQWTGQAWAVSSQTELSCASVWDGKIYAALSEDTVGVLDPDQGTAPVQIFSCNGTPLAVAPAESGVLLLEKDGTVYRTLQLTEESEPESSSAVSSGTSSQAAGSSEGSKIPIHQEPSESSGSTTESSEGSSETSGKEEALVLQSTAYSIDADTHTVWLPEGTTLAAFRKTVPSNSVYLQAERYDGTSLESGILGTGTRLFLQKDSTTSQGVVVLVRGDLNGNGVVNSADSKLLRKHLTGEQPLISYFYTAADLDQDQVVDTRDLLLLEQK